MSASTSSGDFVSCLMVTRGRPRLAWQAIRCFLRQSHGARELLIVSDDPDDVLERAVRRLSHPLIRWLGLPDDGLPLGALRNRAVAESRGRWICQWDDDDLSHPDRLALQLQAIQRAGSTACVLSRTLIWWPHLMRLGVGPRRACENTLICRRSRLPSYPALRRGEDTPVVVELAQRGQLIALDLPRLYVYVAHGRNTFDAPHFDNFWQTCLLRWEGDQGRTRLRELEDELPLAAYARALGLDSTGSGLPNVP